MLNAQGSNTNTGGMMNEGGANVNHASQSLSESGIQASEQPKKEGILDKMKDTARSLMQGETGSGEGGFLDKIKNKVSSYMNNSQSSGSLKQDETAPGRKTGMASQTEAASGISAETKARM